jgi:hypothetical protein
LQGIHGIEIEEYPQSGVSLNVEIEDEDVFLLTATFLLAVHGRDTTGSHLEYDVLQSENVLLEKKSDECFLMGYHVRYPTYLLFRAHCFFTANTDTRHENACFPQITMQRFNIPPQSSLRSGLNADIPSMQRESFHPKDHIQNTYLQIRH